jgi:hypothetical protein
MRLRAAPLALACLSVLPACENVDKFDTKGEAAYCGSIIDAQFIRTLEDKGGFGHDARMRLQLDTAHLNSAPGRITTDDMGCGDSPTLSDAQIRVQPEMKHDSLYLMTFEDGQVQNIVGWVDVKCRGSVLVILSLLKTDRVDVRLLEPKDLVSTDNDVFSVFQLTRNESGCGF